MASQQAIVFGVVLPIVISFVVMLIAWRPWRPRNTSGALFGGQWGGAVAVGAGYLVGHVGIHGWPSVNAGKAQHVVFFSVLLGMIVGIWPKALSARLKWRIVGIGSSAFGMLWLLLRWKMIVSGQWAVWQIALWASVCTVGIVLFWALISILRIDAEEGDELRPARCGFDTPFVLSGVAGLGALLIGFNGHYESGAQASGALALALLVSSLVCLWRPGVNMMRSVTPVIALTLPMMWIDATLRADLGYGYAMTLASAPGLAVVGGRVVPSEAHNLVRTAARVFGAAIPLGILVVIEVAKFVSE